ncbi:hypothetical protein E1J24_22905 [Xanthomonas hortorum pv. pelargonii]|uniref:Resolvase/invertase-type recombinase catalytic domain-containing protein n=1 Tax=Xanthomonas hortorum pv. pelargonii TaxID=453602 RepID=A0AAX0A1L5_9XANT|nr:hypothetical protein [Xanthomonas hortorum pv. pelargonii]
MTSHAKAAAAERAETYSWRNSIEGRTNSSTAVAATLASLAVMERELIVKRTRAGLEMAHQLGRRVGRKHLHQGPMGDCVELAVMCAGGLAARVLAAQP